LTKLPAVNETFAAMLRYNKDDLPGRKVESIFTLPSRIFYQTHLFPLIKMHGHAEEIFLSLLTRDGEHLPVLLNAQRSVSEGQSVTNCAFIVVQNRKKFEDELVAARNAAETALRENSELIKAKSDIQKQAGQLDEQMQQLKRQNHELKQFNHALTHNLKEPLRKILVFISRLQGDTVNGDIEKLSRASAQMKAVVNSLQQYVWLNARPNNFQLTRLEAPAAKAVKQLGAEADINKLQLQIEELPSIEADEDQVQLLFYHVLSNAYKFRRGETASVKISATVLLRNIFRAVEGRYKYEEFVKLEIRDEGTGFDETYREAVFDLFRKMHHAEGQGLGLALCKKVAENHGGWVEADTRLGEYTIIRVWLPVVHTASPA
jgi:phosphoserine phosphatase RsbU/P